MHKRRDERIAGEELLVYWVMAGVFGIATTMFLWANMRRRKEKLLSTSHILVSFVTTISYLVMALELATVLSASGEPVYWSRWLFYIASCTLLTVDVGVIMGKKEAIDLFQIAVLTGLVMFCGFLASFVVTVERWLFFLLSSGAYVGMLYALGRDPRRESDSQRGIFLFIAVFWSLFPLVFVLAPTGIAMVTTFFESVLYAVLDIITKIVFGIWITLRTERQ